MLFTFLSPIGLSTAFVGILYGFTVSKYFSYRRAVYSGIFLSIVAGVIYFAITILPLTTLCATFDSSPCTLTQSQIFRSIFQSLIGYFGIMAFLFIIPGTVGVLIGGYIGKLRKNNNSKTQLNSK